MDVMVEIEQVINSNWDIAGIFAVTFTTQDEIAEIHNWCVDTFGHVYVFDGDDSKYAVFFEMYGNAADYGFRDDKDAMAFKMRWVTGE